jgi:hypothetical protein
LRPNWIKIIGQSYNTFLALGLNNVLRWSVQKI